jgi:hypothetical protein
VNSELCKGPRFSLKHEWFPNRLDVGLFETVTRIAAVPSECVKPGNFLANTRFATSTESAFFVRVTSMQTQPTSENIDTANTLSRGTS